MASVSCDTPKAARWRSPNSLGISRLCETGRMHPAAFIRLWLMIIAPSCNGLFLKKIFSMRRWLILASIRSPVRTMSSNGKSFSITISAPTLPLLIFRQAITIGMMSSFSVSVFLLPFRKRNRLLLRCLEPNDNRKWRISSWNKTISAITPTLTSLSKIEPNSLIWSTCDTITQMIMNTRIPMKILMEPDDFISL